MLIIFCVERPREEGALLGVGWSCVAVLFVCLTGKPLPCTDFTTRQTHTESQTPFTRKFIEGTTAVIS